LEYGRLEKKLWEESIWGIVRSTFIIGSQMGTAEPINGNNGQSKRAWLQKVKRKIEMELHAIELNKPLETAKEWEKMLM